MRRLFTFFLVAALTACNRQEEQLYAASIPAPTHQASPSALACQIDASKITGPVNRGLFGTNIEWFNNGNGVVDDTGLLRPSFVRLGKEQGLSLVRFPGGTLSDYYHWRDGIGPLSSRPARKHSTDAGTSRNVFGTPEFIRFCRQVGAEPLITVNAGTGDAAEAAAWVAYCNAPVNAARAADGMVAPLGVKYWEVGNELYLPGNPGDVKIGVTPEVYADRFLAFAARMRAVDPKIQLLCLGVGNATRVRLPYEDWTEKVLSRAAAEIDLLAVHNAYFPNVFNERGLITKDVYQTLWAAPEAVERNLVKLENLITTYKKGRDIGIAITEWGALFSFDPQWVDHVKTMGTGVYIARLMQVMLTHPRVRLANAFKFTDNNFMGWVGFDGIPKVPYYVFQSYAQHFGTRLVAATINSPAFQSRALGATEAESGVPEITVVASLSDTGNKLYVNLVNRSWATIHRCQVALSGFTPASSQAIGWVVAAPNVTDHNGPDLPSDLAGRFLEPPRTIGRVSPVNLERRQYDLSQPISIDPYSVVTLEIDAGT